MKKRLLILTVILAILLTGCGSSTRRDLTVEKEYGLYQLNKEEKTIVDEHTRSFLLYTKSKSITSERQDLNFFYTLENGETKEAVFKDIDINKVSYVFIEDDQQPKLKVEFESCYTVEISEIEELEKDIHIYNIRDLDFEIVKFAFHIPKGTIKKLYQVN